MQAPQQQQQQYMTPARPAMHQGYAQQQKAPQQQAYMQQQMVPPGSMPGTAIAGAA